jgi:hypothetical protein
MVKKSLRHGKIRAEYSLYRFPEGVARVFSALPGQPEIHIVPAGHFAFLPPCSSQFAADQPRFCTDPTGFDRAAFHHDFNASVARFFRNHLAGDGGVR